MTLAFKCSRAYSNVIGGLRLFDFAIEEDGATKERGRKRRNATLVEGRSDCFLAKVFD